MLVRLVGEVHPVWKASARGDVDPDSDDGGDGCSSSASTDFQRPEWETEKKWDQAAQQVRLEKLLSKLRVEQRREVLEGVSSWLEDRAAIARRDLIQLRRSDSDRVACDRELDDAACRVEKELDQHGRLSESMRDFCRTLGDVDSKRRRAATPKAGLDGAFPPAELMPLVEVEAAMEELRTQLSEREAHLRELLESDPGMKVVDAMEAGLSPAASGNVAPQEDSTEPREDCLVEGCRRLELHMCETIEGYEERTRLLRESLDQIRLDSSGRLSRECLQVVHDIREEVRSAMLPELQAEREAEHGADLKPGDEAFLDCLVHECESLDRRLSAASRAIGRLSFEGAKEADVAARIAEARAGGMIHLPALTGSMEVFDCGIKQVAPRMSQLGSSLTQVAAKASAAVADTEHDGNQVEALTELVRKEVQECMDDEYHILAMIAEVSAEILEDKEEVCRSEERRAALLETGDTLRSQRRLFGDALDVARQVMSSVRVPKAFVADEGWCSPRAFSTQAAAIAEMTAQEKQLQIECSELEAAVQQQLLGLDLANDEADCHIFENLFEEIVCASQESSDALLDSLRCFDGGTRSRQPDMALEGAASVLAQHLGGTRSKSGSTAAIDEFDLGEADWRERPSGAALEVLRTQGRSGAILKELAEVEAKLEKQRLRRLVLQQTSQGESSATSQTNNADSTEERTLRQRRRSLSHILRQISMVAETARIRRLAQAK